MKRARARRLIARLRTGTAVKVDLAAEEAAELKRVAARLAWARRTADEWHEAQQAAHDAWMRLIAPYDDWDEEDLPDLPPPPEQAVVDALWRQLEDVRRRDLWPRHLHWTV